MDPQVFAVLANFLKANSGLALTPDKAYLVNSRLQPIAAQHSCKDVTELVSKLSGAALPIIRRDVIEAMTTNETSFFRDTTPFENFKAHVLPELLERRKSRRNLRVLCAAASSGQEPYSLAMILAESSIHLSGWTVEIIGVDLDTKILKRAEEATYSQFEVQRGLPVQLLIKYFEQCGQSWRLKPQVRNMVRFRPRNLLEPLTDLGTFDVIFCRNVLIYFDPPTKKNVLGRLADQLTTDGFLFLGGAETVLDITNRFIPSPGRRGMYVMQESVRPTRMAG